MCLRLEPALQIGHTPGYSTCISSADNLLLEELDRRQATDPKGEIFKYHSSVQRVFLFLWSEELAYVSLNLKKKKMPVVVSVWGWLQTIWVPWDRVHPSQFQFQGNAWGLTVPSAETHLTPNSTELCAFSLCTGGLWAKRTCGQQPALDH